MEGKLRRRSGVDEAGRKGEDEDYQNVHKLFVLLGFQLWSSITCLQMDQ